MGSVSAVGVLDGEDLREDLRDCIIIAQSSARVALFAMAIDAGTVLGAAGQHAVAVAVTAATSYMLKLGGWSEVCVVVGCSLGVGFAFQLAFLVCAVPIVGVVGYARACVLMGTMRPFTFIAKTNKSGNMV